jgi:aspartyl-tRNA(Asn)/glutamyl-tRNA(Gln) amidotransferase subunit A
MPLSHSLDHVGPLARSAEDTALLLQAIAGHDPQDPATSARPVPDYLAGLQRGVAGLRLAMADAGLDTTLEAEVAILVGESVDRLAQLGMQVARIEVPAFAPMNALRRLIMLVECAALHRDRVVAARERYNPQTLARMEPGFPVSGVDYARALAARAPLLRRFCAEVFAEVDVLALPTCPVPTPGIRETDTGGDARFTAVANRLGTLVGPFNLLGLPAINVPAGLDRRGLPVGLQLVAKPFGEALLLRVAHALEIAGGTFAPSPAAPRP